MPQTTLQTLAIIAVTCLVSFMAFSNPGLVQRMLMWPYKIKRERQVERFVTHGFIHADGTHLLFNMITLYFFGSAMEKLYISIAGQLGFVFFYILGLVVSSLPDYFRYRDVPGYMSLGASGAVSGVLFGFILLQPWATIYIFVIPVPAILYAVAYIIYSVVMDKKKSDNVAHSAHLWGAVYGVAMTLILKPALFEVFVRRLLHP